jgi:glycosyltransferase involved in cell wall biosynthesis
MGEVILAVPGDPETVTGGYLFDRRLVTELVGAGHSASILTLPHLNSSSAYESVRPTLAALAGVPRSAALIVDGLAFGVLPAAGLTALARPIVALVHHPLAAEAGLSAERAAALFESERAALATAAHVVVTSPSTARALVEEFGVRAADITVALPGTDPLPRARGSRGPPCILAVGSVIPRKGYDMLLRALDAIRDRRWTCRIVGALDRDPACAAVILAEIEARGLSARVDVVGAVDRARLAALYDEADLFALLSSYEGYGMAFAEALAAGLPVVACAGGAIPDTVPADAGILVAPGDAAAAAAAIGRLLDDPALRRAKAEAARAAGLRLPSWRDTAATVAAAIRRLPAGPPA